MALLIVVPLTIVKSYVVALLSCAFSLSVSGAKLAKLAMPAVPTSSIAVSGFGAISFAQLVQ